MSFNSCTDIETKKIGDVCKQATMWLFKFAQFVTQNYGHVDFCGVEYCKGWSNLSDQKEKGQYGSFVITSSCPCNTRRFHVTMQRIPQNVPKTVIYMQSCCLA